MQLRPSSPMPKAANVERRERSWVLSAGERHFSFTRVEYSASFATGHRIAAPRPRGWRPTTILGAMLVLLGGATLMGLAINSSRASAGYRYVVSLPLPPARPLPGHPTPPVTRHAAPFVRTGATVPSASSAKKSVSDATQPLDYEVGDLDTVEATAAATSMTAAIRAAMGSGHLQQWTAADGSERGFVVVGPAVGERNCRSLSILTRRDGENHVEQRRECVDGKD